MVVCLSDQQLVTGTALSIAALKKLHDTPVADSLSGYHLNIVADLVWFSSNTHLLSLLVVRSFAVSVKPNAPQENGSRARQFTARMSTLLRVVLMCTNAALLLYISYIQGYYDWYNMDDGPVICTVGLDKGGAPLQWTRTNFVLIFYSYSVGIFMLWRSGRRYWLQHWRFRLIDNKSLPSSEERVVWIKGNTLAWKVTRTAFLSLWYLLSSETFDVLGQITWHVLGYYSLTTDRAWGHGAMVQSEKDEENNMGFGQLVPVCLLGLLLVQLLESMAGKKPSHTHQQWDINLLSSFFEGIDHCD